MNGDGRTTGLTNGDSRRRGGDKLPERVRALPKRGRGEIRSRGRPGLGKGGRDKVPASRMSVRANDVMPLVGGRKCCVGCVGCCYLRPWGLYRCRVVGCGDCVAVLGVCQPVVVVSVVEGYCCVLLALDRGITMCC